MKKIILINRDKDVLYLLESLFEAMEWRFFVFEDASEALEFLENNNSDILISDFGTPEFCGYEINYVAKTIRPRIKTICVSNNPRHEDIFIQGGGDLFLPLPIDLRQVWREVNKI